MSGRVALIGDAAITVLAERGMRGLTHRAVDEIAGVPPGSTSYYARTRAALLELALTRLTALDEADLAVTPQLRAVEDTAALAEVVALLLTSLLDAGRVRTLARYELALEATRRPGLRERYDSAGGVIRRHAADLLAAAGSTDPQRHARLLTAWCDGVLFDSIAGAGQTCTPTSGELHLGASELLRGMIDFQ
ncbi:MAG: TetR family transcriptional regulator [Pseudonocardiaceae bacterium]|nr:TetR family transcriptional regulator [Pseudonocardiaceae bacterium]